MFVTAMAKRILLNRKRGIIKIAQKRLTLTPKYKVINLSLKSGLFSLCRCLCKNKNTSTGANGRTIKVSIANAEFRSSYQVPKLITGRAMKALMHNII